ncbi:MAG: ParB/RepB/Spo0J family partition protein [Bacteriovoracales bacterium]|nr:ParB/RepB/Spo0J family partition protein [Bacteriovoracales bacterium]
MKTLRTGKKKLALGKGIASLLESNGGVDMDGFRESISPLAQDKTLGKTLREEKSSGPGAAPEGTALMVSAKDIEANPYQPRKIFREHSLKELADSIAQNGLIQPIVVSGAADGEKFQIISGERRFRACQMAGFDQIPVLVKKVTDRQKLVLAIIENVQRSDLNCIEEALAYYQLMDEFKLTQEEVAKRMGKERSSIANSLRILKLPREVVELLQREDLTFGHGKLLAAIKDPKKCIKVARQIVREALSIRQAELLIKKVGRKKEGTAPSRNTPGTEDGDDWDSLCRALERKTGRRFALKPRSDGSGQIIISYGDRSEFNDIFDYLMG